MPSGAVQIALTSVILMAGSFDGSHTYADNGVYTVILRIADDDMSGNFTAGTNGVDYVDVREDRAIFFATADENVLEINYQIKSTNRGEFVVPPVFAESMYERNIKGRGVGGKITVTE